MEEVNPLRRISVKSEPVEDQVDRWELRAACLGRGHEMFPKKKKDLSYISEARKICRGCTVRAQCLDYALTYPITDIHGVWGGLTPRQLAAEAKRRGVSPTKPTLAQLWSSYGGK